MTIAKENILRYVIFASCFCLSLFFVITLLSVCLVAGRSGLAITLVTPFDVSLFQAVEAHIGDLFNFADNLYCGKRQSPKARKPWGVF